MLDQDDLWLMDLSSDEPSEVLETLPELRQWREPYRSGDELGLRSVLERPDMLARSWRRTANADRHRVKRHADVLRAA